MSSVYFNRLRAIKDTRELSPAEKFVLMIIHTFADTASSTAFPSIETVAAETGLSTKTVSRSVSRLEALGWLLVTRAPWKSGQKRQTNHYAIMVPFKSQDTMSALSLKAETQCPRFSQKRGVNVP